MDRLNETTADRATQTPSEHEPLALAEVDSGTSRASTAQEAHQPPERESQPGVGEQDNETDRDWQGLRDSIHFLQNTTSSRLQVSLRPEAEEGRRMTQLQGDPDYMLRYLTELLRIQEAKGHPADSLPSWKYRGSPANEAHSGAMKCKDAKASQEVNGAWERAPNCSPLASTSPEIFGDKATKVDASTQTCSNLCCGDSVMEAATDSQSTVRVRDEDIEQCSICLAAFVPGATVVGLPCTHHYHRGCVRRWLTTHHTCPLCRADAFPGHKRIKLLFVATYSD